MSKHIHIILWIPLMYVVLFLAFWIRLFLNEEVSFEKFLLEKQANYAADSAIDALLEDSDIDTDYSSDFVTIEPDLAVKDFAHTLCLNKGSIPTDYSIRKLMNNNIRMIAVCGYDGYYVYYMNETATGTYELKSTPKIPYYYSYYSDPDKEAALEPDSDELKTNMSESDIAYYLNLHNEADRQYCLTLDPKVGYWDYSANGKYFTHQRGKYEDGRKEYNNSQGSLTAAWDSDGSQTGFHIPTKDQQLTAINTDVSKGINWALFKTYSTFTSHNHIELPAIGETVRGEQPVKAPTVIAFVEGDTKSYLSSVTAECIGGAQFEDADLVVGFNLDHVKIIKPYRDPDTGTYFYGDEAIPKWQAWCNKRHYEFDKWAYYRKDDSKEWNNLSNPYVTLSGKYYAYSSWWNKHRYIKDQMTTINGQYFDDVFDAAKNKYMDIMPGN